VKRQVLRAPARVGAFVETTVHVRRHRVVVVVVVRAAAFGGRAAAAAAMCYLRYGLTVLLGHTRANVAEKGPTVEKLRRARLVGGNFFFFFKLKRFTR